MRARGIKSDFRATGQTGILISGRGVAHRCGRRRLHRRGRRVAHAGQRCRPLGRGRGPGLAVPSLLRRRDAGPAAWRPARRLRRLPRADAHARCAASSTRCRRSPRSSRRPSSRAGSPTRRSLRRHRHQHRASGRGGGDCAAARRTGRAAWPALRRSDPHRRRARSSIALQSATAPDARELTVAHERWPIAGAFTISRGSKTAADVVVVTLDEDGVDRPRRVRALSALRRNGARRRSPHSRRARGRSKQASDGIRSRSRYCPPGPRAMRWTARCGTSRPSAAAGRVWQLAGLAAAASRSSPPIR